MNQSRYRIKEYQSNGRTYFQVQERRAFGWRDAELPDEMKGAAVDMVSPVGSIEEARKTIACLEADPFEEKNIKFHYE